MLPALIYLTINQQNTFNLGPVSDAQQDRVSLVSEKSYVESPFGEKVSWATLLLEDFKGNQNLVLIALPDEDALE